MKELIIFLCGVGVGFLIFYPLQPRKKCIKCGQKSQLETCDSCWGERFGYQLGYFDRHMNLPHKYKDANKD